MQAHQVDLSVAVDEDVEGYGNDNGDHPDERLTPRCQHGFRLVDVHDDMWRRVLHLRRWRVGVHLSLVLEPKDGVDVEELVLRST
jgi:hypothetical protein